MRRFPFMLVAVLLLSSCQEPPKVSAPPPPTEMEADIKFRGMLASGFPEQDVFVEPNSQSPEVVRFQERQSVKLEMMAHDFRRPVFATTVPLPHDFFKTGEMPVGPFPKGVRIGIPQQTWGNGIGYGTYTVKNGTATLALTFSSLLRNGTYSLWCARISKQRAIEWPCVKPGEPGNPFRSSPKAKGDLDVSFPALPDSTTETGSYLMLAYHSDHHPTAKEQDFGKTTHVQVIARIPRPTEVQPAY